jgi:heptaprenyl diphosphate synthase
MSGEMARVDGTLRTSVANRDADVTELALHLIQAGGKRQRPALAIVSAAAGGGGLPVVDDVIRGGVAVELIQVGSLYHDDVLDDAQLRRGIPTVNAAFGNRRAILGGDYLLAKASEIAASIGVEVAGLLASTIAAMCEGQVQELSTAWSTERSEAQYFESVAGKTASVFAAACRVGAVVAALPTAQIDALTSFGRSYGITFQLVDDVLDVVATEEELGKPAGNDMAEGVYTLPVLRTLAAGDDAATELTALLGRPLEPAEVERARKLVRAGTGVDQTIEVARRHADDAVRSLAPLGESPYTKALSGAAMALLDTIPS